MKHSKLLIMVVGLWLTSTTSSYALVESYMLDHDDPSVQRYRFTEREAYDMPVRVDETILVHLDTEITGASMDNEKDYSFIPLPDRKGFFLIPQRSVGNTVTVVTMKRVYVFKTRTVANRIAKYLSFDYSEKISHPRVKVVASEDENQSLMKRGFGSSGLNHTSGDRINKNYTYKGDKALLPSMVIDNGKFTVMKFKNIAPLVYEVMPNRRERLVNSHLEDGHLVIHQTASQFTLRMDKQTLCLFRNGDKQ